MKTATTALKSLIASPTVTLTTGDCFVFKFVSGSTLNMAAFDRDILLNSVTYSSGLAYQPNSVGRIGFKQQRGFQGDDIVVEIASENATAPTIQGLPLKEAVVAGLFDGCIVTVYRIFNPVILPSGIASVDATSYGSVTMFVGYVADAEVTHIGIRLTCKTTLDLLNQYIPRAVYQPGCQWTLFDAGCQLLQTNYELVNIQAQAGSTDFQVYVSSLTIPNTGIPGAGTTMPDGWLNEGALTFVSGLNNGLTRSIQYYLGAGNEKDYSVAVLNDKPLAYYKLGDAHGSSTVADSSGNGYTGTVHGSLDLGVTGPLTGDSTTAASFDGSTAYLTLPVPKPSTVSETFGGWAIEFWFQPTNSAFRGIFDTSPGNSDTIRNANVLPSSFQYSAVEWNPDEPRVGLAGSTSSWSHCVINFYGVRYVDVYINGNYFTGGSDANPPNGNTYTWNNPITVGRTLAPITLGLSAVNQYYEGTLAQLAIYTYPLSIDQVQTHYLAGTTSPSTNPNGIIYLFDSLPYAPAAGDRMNLLPGCDKTTHTCVTKFNNLTHNSSMPYVPDNSVAF